MVGRWSGRRTVFPAAFRRTLCAAVVVSIVLLGMTAGVVRADPPNIVFIIVDDLCYGYAGAAESDYEQKFFAVLDEMDRQIGRLDGPLRRETPLYWYYPNDLRSGDSAFATPPLAVRSGPWKLLADPKGEAVELYHLEDDPRERRNVADDHPGLRDRLLERATTWYRVVLSNEE